ncbi:MAG: hypothetical protein AAGA48_35205, partial [Myxococcota bacterium]
MDDELLADLPDALVVQWSHTSLVLKHKGSSEQRKLVGWWLALASLPALLPILAGRIKDVASITELLAVWALGLGIYAVSMAFQAKREVQVTAKSIEMHRSWTKPVALEEVRSVRALGSWGLEFTMENGRIRRLVLGGWPWSGRPPGHSDGPPQIRTCRFPASGRHYTSVKKI